jgi:AmmeMemoRadiSam system protein B
MIRQPAVAGYFYPRDPRVLQDEIQVYLQEEESGGARPSPATAIISPHAGYQYSGRVAASVFSRVKIPQKLFILSPNHSGEGAPVAINSSGAWLTPLGEAKIDERIAQDFASRFPGTEEDSAAHATEHSLEVQIPFVQYLKKDFRFVPSRFSISPMSSAKGSARPSPRPSKTPERRF